MMSFGGNAKCNKFLAQYGVTSATHSIAQKYNSPAALLYRDRLLALVEGRELPTELPKVIYLLLIIYYVLLIIYFL